MAWLTVTVIFTTQLAGPANGDPQHAGGELLDEMPLVWLGRADPGQWQCPAGELARPREGRLVGGPPRRNSSASAATKRPRRPPGQADADAFA